MRPMTVCSCRIQASGNRDSCHTTPLIAPKINPTSPANTGADRQRTATGNNSVTANPQCGMGKTKLTPAPRPNAARSQSRSGIISQRGPLDQSTSVSLIVCHTPTISEPTNTSIPNISGQMCSLNDYHDASHYCYLLRRPDAEKISYEMDSESESVTATSITAIIW